ncbi:glutamine amidotransferase [Exiguobacterium indicum]|uniref:Pyridoxal 5'-phosphate synthase subunit PdxT n=1 Tax=Exiguobacterium indicum TaxID=296995 RepID=A0AAW3M996_9BACL|nr:pyridoxal 5'-phosphate synthase glutaminase subunit PdxT [Exiguobacterium indicum]KTR25338.1 glutamine amidotransferase [Exiguobacterium indicum]
MVIGILDVQGAVREHRQQLEGLGVDVVLVKQASDLEKLDGLVLPGGESTAMRRLIERYELQEPLREKAATLPMFGTCAGMILLATAIEAGQSHLNAISMTVRRNAFGRQIDSFEGLLPVEGIEEPIEAVFIRAPLILSVGEGTRVIAKVEEQIVAVETSLHLACSFHPELTEDNRLHQYFLQKIKQRQSVRS